jgi:predicted RNA methylase
MYDAFATLPRACMMLLPTLQVTSPHLAASFLFTALSNDDIEGKCVLDLGCGCGMLSIAASLCGAEFV